MKYRPSARIQLSPFHFPRRAFPAPARRELGLPSCLDDRFPDIDIDVLSCDSNSSGHSLAGRRRQRKLDSSPKLFFGQALTCVVLHHVQCSHRERVETKDFPPLLREVGSPASPSRWGNLLDNGWASVGGRSRFTCGFQGSSMAAVWGGALAAPPVVSKRASLPRASRRKL